MIPGRIPHILELYLLVYAEILQEIRYLGITVDPHIPGKQRMVESISVVILSRVILRDNGVRRQIQKQSSISSYNILNDAIQVILRNDLPDNKERAYMKAAAPLRFYQQFLRNLLRKIDPVILIRKHACQVIFALFADCNSLGISTFPFR